jgi:hypothetical protein
MKTIQSLKILTLAAVIWAASFPVVSSAAESKINFTDINGHWALSSIGNAVNRGYVDGYADRTFKPDLNITRAEFIKMAVAALGYKLDATPGAAWYAQALAAAQSNNLITVEETGDDGALNQPIQRLEMSKIAVRSTGTTTDEANKWMYLATSTGIINGLDDQGTIGADQPTTRAQAITVIERMLKLKAGEKLPSDKYATSAAEVSWHKTNVYTMAPEYFGWGVANKMPFEVDKLRYDGANGYSETEKYIVVDMGDPTDPNRKLIPDSMRWITKVGNERTATKEVPTNAYAFLSFDHFYVESETPLNGFFYSYLDVRNLYITGDNVGKDGQLLDVTPYAESAGDGPWINFGHITLPAGTHDKRLVTGQLVPKLKGVDGNGFSVYKQPAQGLGEKGSHIVYESIISTSLGGK